LNGGGRCEESIVSVGSLAEGRTRPGSVCALRLAETGYSVLVLEKGRRWRPHEFPETNWNLRRWLWRPGLGSRGIFGMTFLRHLTSLGRVGVGANPGVSPSPTIAALPEGAMSAIPPKSR